jgi:phosphatidate phosphatase APP1
VKIKQDNRTSSLSLFALAGMADVYRQWYLSNKNCTFHYLSGMPDQLYTLTQEFIYTNNFPDGSFHMRHFGWATASLFEFLHSESTFLHKTNQLRFFLTNTARDLVLVGDSGEKDPEIYGSITREYPQRIRAIFIRAIKGETFNDERFLTAFQGVAPEKWQIFNEPQQLPVDLSRSPKATPS